MTNNIFVGTWRLISCETRFDNQVIYLFGPKPIGYLMYSEEGYMSVNIMKANRQPFSSKNMMKMSQEEKIATAEDFHAYSGKYEILTANTIVHYPEVHVIPNLIGVPQERTFQMTESRLSLSTPPTKLDDRLVTSHLVWERV